MKKILSKKIKLTSAIGISILFILLEVFIIGGVIPTYIWGCFN